MKKTETFTQCEEIAKTLESIYNGELFRCPECGELIGEATTCPECGEQIEEAEPFTLWDYFSDVYDIEYRISGDREFRSVCLMVACGGPNIYIDTGSKQVELYWWGTTEKYPLDYDVCEEINEIFEEIYNC